MPGEFFKGEGQFNLSASRVQCAKPISANSLTADARRVGRALDHSALLSLIWIGLALTIFSAVGVRVDASPISVLSPDRAVELKIFADNTNVTLEVLFHSRLVVENSPLVFSVDGVNLMNGAEVGEVKRYEPQAWYPWRGGHRRATNHCNVATIRLRHGASGTQHTLEIRAFNDGAAFRHFLPTSHRPRVPDEARRWCFPKAVPFGIMTWRVTTKMSTSKADVSAVKAGQWCAPPLAFKLPGAAGYGAITEAALVNYSGMALRADGRRGFEVALAHKHPASYPFRLRYSNDVERVAKPASISGAITSPWRVVVVGADLNALVNSDIVHNLARHWTRSFFPRAWKPTGSNRAVPSGNISMEDRIRSSK
jgi:alpha-glucosidase